MKRRLPHATAILGLALSLAHSVAAQDPVATAAREEAAANYRDLSAKVLRLEEDLNSAQRQVRSLIDANHRLRIELDQQKKPVENTVTLERITKLQTAIKQVDDARLADNKRAVAEIAKLVTAIERVAKIASTVHIEPAPRDPPPRDPLPPTTPNRNETTTPAPPRPAEHGFEYTIKKGDTLSGIMTAAKEQKGLKLTRKQMDDANPSINWDRLQVGKKIFIPASAP